MRFLDQATSKLGNGEALNMIAERVARILENNQNSNLNIAIRLRNL